MTDPAKANSIATINETKHTATEIEENCPAALQDLAKRIAVQYEKAVKYADKADQNYNSVAQLLATAQEACDEGGFNAFREKFFPNLGKSRVYELLAIGTGNKSVEEIRAGNRARQTKHRANNIAAPVSVTVTETSEPGAECPPKENSEIEAPGIASDQTPEPAKPRSVIAPGDEALSHFNVRVHELNRTTENRQPERFSKTAVPVEVLERLGNRLINIAKLKRPADGEARDVDFGADQGGRAPCEEHVDD